MKQDLVLWFEKLRKTDIPSVGGKNANLGEMTSAGIPVPPGFAITAYSYKKFIEETGIAQKIYEIIDETVKDKNDPAQYEVASKKIRELIESTSMPKEIENAIKNAYEELNRKLNIKDVFVAVRSSATAEDLADASFAGQQETFLNIRGVKSCPSKHGKMLVKSVHSSGHFLPQRERFCAREGLHQRRGAENGQFSRSRCHVHVESSNWRSRPDSY